jgi:hypothetical protein
MTDKNLALTDEELTALEAHAQGDVLRLIAEVRGLRAEVSRQRTVLDQADAMSKHLETGVNHIAEQNTELLTALAHLDTIIAAYNRASAAW